MSTRSITLSHLPQIHWNYILDYLDVFVVFFRISNKRAKLITDKYLSTRNITIPPIEIQFFKLGMLRCLGHFFWNAAYRKKTVELYTRTNKDMKQITTLITPYDVTMKSVLLSSGNIVNFNTCLLFRYKQYFESNNPTPNQKIIMEFATITLELVRHRSFDTFNWFLEKTLVKHTLLQLLKTDKGQKFARATIKRNDVRFINFAMHYYCFDNENILDCLQYAIDENCVISFKYLLDKYLMNATEQDQTLAIKVISYTVRANRPDCFQVMFTYGTLELLGDCISYVITEGHLEIIETLLKYNYNLQPFLKEIITSGNTKIIDLMIKYKKVPGDIISKTIELNNYPMLSYLMKNQIPINSTTVTFCKTNKKHELLDIFEKYTQLSKRQKIVL